MCLLVYGATVSVLSLLYFTRHSQPATIRDVTLRPRMGQGINRTNRIAPRERLKLIAALDSRLRGARGDDVAVHACPRVLPPSETPTRKPNFVHVCLASSWASPTAVAPEEGGTHERLYARGRSHASEYRATASSDELSRPLPEDIFRSAQHGDCRR